MRSVRLPVDAGRAGLGTTAYPQEAGVGRLSWAGSSMLGGVARLPERNGRVLS
ncbi:hypothetical protein ABWJ92_23905 [Streptomyces sp. NPDC000609]|uniref:hypothetical protein n=1 Tax=Streptomyces sp. NPDC000609 TaxID=3160957 RepID=UPI003392765C